MANIHWSPSLLLHLQRHSSTAPVAPTPPRSQHRAAYSNQPQAQVQHRAPWRIIAAAAQHRASYGNQPQAQTQHRAPCIDWPQAKTAHHAKWGIVLAAAHSTRWTDPSIATAQHRAAYADKATQAAQHTSPWQTLAAQATQHRAAYADKATQAAQHTSPWQTLAAQATRHTSSWSLLAGAFANHIAQYHLQSAAIASSTHRTPYHLLNAAIHSISNTPSITHGAAILPIFAATLSADEDSPHWLASITLTSAADYGSIQIGDTITLHLGPTAYTLRIDAKASQRQSPQDTTYTASAISPLAWLDAPWAGQVDHIQTTAVLASAAVQAIIGPVQWAAPDWTIPAGALQITSATPLAAARAIAAAIGAVIESQPDGSTLVRPRHPVSPPAYTLAACTHHLIDATTFASTASAAPLRGFNRLEVTNNTSATTSASADSLEYMPDDTSTDATSGTVRAILASARPVLLAHSGHPSTAIAAQGSVTRTETELIEFVAGQASLQYPADSITACTWQHTDLGAPAITAGDTTAITAATPGYSLARISYQTTALQWRVQLATPAETVQFILLDA